MSANEEECSIAHVKESINKQFSRREDVHWRLRVDNRVEVLMDCKAEVFICIKVEV
jgi:hypothetical protein